MTYQEFIYTLPTLADTDAVVFNYNSYPGGIYRLDAIAIDIGDRLEELQQATTITLQISGSNDYTNVPVDNSSYPVRVVDRSVLGTFYVYNILTENQRPIITYSGTSSYQSDLLIEPGTNITPNTLVDYAAIQNTIDVSRESTYIVRSDRATTTTNSKTNPTNLYSILNNQAIPASLQDSNYSNTGWINARYEGTKVSTTNNQGISPILSGIAVEAALYSLDAEDTYLTNLSESEIKYKPYLSTGRLLTPSYTVESLKLNYKSTGTSNSLLNFEEPVPFANAVPPLTVGDLLIISSSSGLKSEILQIVSPTTDMYYPYEYIQTTEIQQTFQLRVRRGYNGTLIQSYNADDKLYRIVTTKIYDILQGEVENTPAGKLRVQGIPEVLYLDSNGQVVSGSIRYIQ